MKWVLVTLVIFFTACRETLTDERSPVDRMMESQIIGKWIYDTGNPPFEDSTILVFDFNNSMLIVDYGQKDTLDYFRYKIRDSALILINLAFYPRLYEIEYRILWLNQQWLTIARYQYRQMVYSKTYRKIY